jgi:hypothetical protein
MEFFVYLNEYQEAPFIIKSKTPLDAIEEAINENVHRHPGYFATASEIRDPKKHFMSRSGIFVRDTRFPNAMESYWEA